MQGSRGKDQLAASLPDYSLNLSLAATHGPSLHGVNGVIPYGPFGTSNYYSYTSLLTHGTLIDHGVPVRVAGVSWMDHQWGAINLASGGGWDWFSMQLSNGQQYMLYYIKNPDGSLAQTIATRVDARGRTTAIPAADVSETRSAPGTAPSPISPIAPAGP